jgi:hypothetical protein
MQSRAIGPAQQPYRNPLQQIGGVIGDALSYLSPGRNIVPQYVQEQEPDALRDLVGSIVSPANLLTSYATGSLGALRGGAKTVAANTAGRPAANLAPDLWSQAPSRLVSNVGRTGRTSITNIEQVEDAMRQGMAIEDAISMAAGKGKKGRAARASLEALYRPGTAVSRSSAIPGPQGEILEAPKAWQPFINRSVGAARAGSVPEITDEAGRFLGGETAARVSAGGTSSLASDPHAWEQFMKYVRNLR